MSKETASGLAKYDASQNDANAYEAPTDERAELSRKLLAYFNAVVYGTPRKQLFRITTLEKAIGDTSGNVRRWIAGGYVNGRPCVPTLSTLQLIDEYMRAQGVDVNTK
jgi:hypothetical protein